VIVGEDLKVKYAEQLKAAKEMGLENEDKYLELLVRANGDQQRAMDTYYRIHGS